MIRQWFILGMLVIITFMLSWDFATKAMFYSPITNIKSAEKPEIEQTAPIRPYSPAWGNEIVENNLLSPERGYIPPPLVTPKPEVEEKKVEPPPLPKPNLTLNGIIFNQFGEYVAYIQVDGGKAIPAREGDIIAGARVLKIHERAVEMGWNDEVFWLALSKIKNITR